MAAKSAKFYIPSLDGIRAIAFLIVFISHAGLGKIIPGGFGVTIFFFLSGYLITTQLRREYDRSHKIDFKNFYMRRVLRIWPPFYLVLFLAIGISYLVSHQAGFSFQQIQAFSTQFLHISNYYNIEVGNQWMALGTEVYWSLAVEEHFYLLFPLLYVLLLRLGIQSKQQVLIFWGICLVVLLWRCLLIFGMGANYERIFYASDTRLDSILFGCVLAVAGNPAIEQDRQISERTLKYWLLPLACTLILCSLLYRSDAFRDTLRYSVQGIALYPIFIAAIRFPDWGLFKALNWGWMRFIGLLSYSLYLVHFMVIKVLAVVLPGLGLLGSGVLSLLISLALAAAIYRFVEIPAAKLKQKFASH
jgi:peptidoglycan/LPS O-acetylase OafA/YrhL